MHLGVVPDMKQPELIEETPRSIEEVIPESQLNQRHFELVSQGYALRSAESLGNGTWKIRAEHCRCSLCTSGRAERLKRLKAEAEREQPNEKLL
jgi:hypothetical protein